MLYVAAWLFSHCHFRKVLAFAGLAILIGCSDSKPLVEFLEGSQFKSENLQISDFTPSANPTNSTADKSVQVTAGPLWEAFKSVVVASPQDCTTADFSGATATKLPGNVRVLTPAQGSYRVCVIGKKYGSAWDDISKVISSSSMIIDTTAPQGTFLSQTANDFNSTMEVSLDLDEEVVPLTASAFTFSNAVLTTITMTTPQKYTATFVPIADGPVTVTLNPSNIVDRAGNAFGGGLLTLTRTYDGTPPQSASILINSGTALTKTLSADLALAAVPTPNQMYITSVSGCASGGTWTAFSPNPSYMLNPNAPNTVYVKYRDQAMNESACVSASITHDDILPTASATGLPTYVKSSFAITYTFSEPVQTLSVADFVVSGGTKALTGSGTTYSLNVTPTASGTVSITLPSSKIMDLAGNWASSNVSSSTTADLLPPSVPAGLALGDVPKNLTQTPELTFTGSTDALSGVNRYEVRLLDSSAAVVKNWFTATSPLTVGSLSLLENKTYEFQVRAIDNAGNVSGFAAISWQTFQRPYTLNPWSSAPNGEVFSIATISNSKLLVGGNFSNFAPSSSFMKFGLKLSSSGFADAAFLVDQGFDGPVTSSIANSDGSVYVGGHFDTYKGGKANKIAHINSDGSRDVSFSSVDGFDYPVLAMAKEANGNLVVGGHFSMYSGQGVSHIARLLASGALDTSFATGSGFDGYVQAIGIQSDGKIIVGGNFTTFNGSPIGNVARLNPNGTLDHTFAVGTGFDNVVTALAVQADDSIVIAGDFNQLNGNPVQRVIRLTPNGSLDGSFAMLGGPNNSVYAITLDSSQKILLGGSFTNYNSLPSIKLARLTTTGALDTFSVPPQFNGTVHSIATIPGSSDLLVGGDFDLYRSSPALNLVRMTSTGTRVTAYSYAYELNGPVKSISTFSGGGSFVGGDFTSYGSTGTRNLTKLTSSYAPEVMTSAGTGFNGPVERLHVQGTDGKILVAGSFDHFGADVCEGLCRISETGAFDSSFNAGTGATGIIRSVVQQSNGNIFVAGNFGYFNGISSPGLVRLTAAGAVDNAFIRGVGFDSVVTQIAEQDPTHLIAVGNFTKFNNVTANRIVRIHTAASTGISPGDKDNSFNSGSGFDGPVRAIAIQADKAILVSGDFSHYDGVAVPNLVRLNADGTLDSTFTSKLGTGPDVPADEIHVDANGKIVIAGAFQTVDGNNLRQIARINSAGFVDTSFRIGAGFNLNVNTIKLLANGNIAVGGKYYNYLGEPTFNFSVLVPP